MRLVRLYRSRHAGGADDTWTESGLTWNTQPAFGAALDTQTLAQTSSLWYSWNVGSLVQQKWAGNKLVSILLKPVSEGSADATAPSYAFDAKEYGSNAPMLSVRTQTSSAPIANLKFYYRYSADNLNWGAWTLGATATAAPYQASFAFPQGQGYYEFYSVATDSQGNTEAAPAAAQAAVHHQAASGQTQTISFAALAPTTVGTSVRVVGDRELRSARDIQQPDGRGVHGGGQSGQHHHGGYLHGGGGPGGRRPAIGWRPAP